jgi:uncharacterized protein MJ1531
MTRKPSYRFAGYTESWEERKFGQLIRSIQTGTTLLGSEQNNGIPLLKMGNIQRGYWDLTKIERLEQEIESENIVKYGDFIFNTRNTLELVGKGATWVLKNGIYGFNSNLARVIFDGIDTIFFNYLYNIPNSISQVKARAVGTTSVAAVYPRDLYSINFSLPSLPEQTAIGSFFQDIDQLISLQQRKLEVLKEQKKTYLKLLFPAKGQTKPALRFAGFEDEWKEVKLGEVFKISSGFTGDSSLHSGSYKLTRIETISDGLINVKKLGYSNVAPDDSYKLGIGEILFSNINSIEHIGKVALYDKDYGLYHGINLLRLQPIDVNGIFSFYELGTIEKRNWARSHANKAVNQASINQTILSSLNLQIPSLPEQEAIGSFFQDLDKAIAKQEEKVNQLKESKQTLLRKMFI